MIATIRLYWEDDHCFETQASVVDLAAEAVAFDRTCFYPGGGGQPPDTGIAILASGEVLEITAARAGADDVVWHVINGPLTGVAAGQSAKLTVNRERRVALARHHTVLHILNTIALRDYAAWITGVQIGEDYSRIDFRLEQLSAELCRDLEAKVNAVLEGNRKLESRFLPESDFRARPELLRTLEAQPPVIGGQVRVVEIEGFDEQACGGTHVATTAEVGRLAIYKTENKGKNNKRLYLRLSPV